MAERTVRDADLARLKSDQEAAGRQYNDALTNVDHAIQSAPERPSPPTPYDEFQINALNERWRVVPEHGPDFESGWRGKLARFVWELISPYLREQQAFNSAVVDHVNRNIEGHRHVRAWADSTMTLLQNHFAGMTHFQSMLVQYLQRVTPFVDTKDYEFVGILRRLTEDNRELLDVYRELLDVYRERNEQALEEIRGRIDVNWERNEQALQGLEARLRRVDDLEQVVDGFAGGLSGVSDELQMRWESMVARERRYDAKVTGLSAGHDEIRTSISVMQQAVQAIRRTLEHVDHAAPSTGAAAPQVPDAAPAATATAFTSAIDAYKYVGFEDQFRGSQEDIRTRVAEYLPLFEGASDVLDVGCGRGEFLDLLREHGIAARGLDINREMVAVCHERGLEADEGDALAYLTACPDDSLGGLFAAQVVEHLQPDYLLHVIDVAYRKLRPGSPIVLETINPACWFAFFESYIRDISHVRPIHPDTLRYFLLASGFQHVEIRYRAPYPEHEKLKPLPGEGEMIETFNANVEKLNGLLFTHLDYAAIGQKAR